MRVPFIDVKGQNKVLKKKSMAALSGLLDSGDFVLGKPVRDFEKRFADYCGAKYAAGVNSGTDALFLGLLSLGIKPGDEVLCPVYTYIATALSVSYTGAKPVFVDIDRETFNINIADFKKKISKRTKAIIAVHLYGRPALMPKIIAIAKKHKLKVIEDAAQAHGAQIKIKKNKWRKVGTFGDIGCFSFYPTKNLSGCGDAGLVTTNSKKIHQRLLMLRDQGRKGKRRYMHYIKGYNSRMDSIQAVLLNEKLTFLDKCNSIRRQRAKQYTRGIAWLNGIKVIPEDKNLKNVYHIYPVLIKDRNRVLKKLKEYGISAGIVYHRPLHLQPAYKDLKHKKGDFPQAEYVCRHILCLPMHTALTEKQVGFVVKILNKIICK